MKLGWEKRELSFLFIHYYFYLVNTGMGKKLNKKIKAHPPESPLNGGIKSTIPLRGGVPLPRRGGYLSSVILSGAFPREDLIF